MTIPRWHHDDNMRTTANIDDAILKELHERAASSGRSFREVVYESLALGLGRLSKPPKGHQFRVRPHPLGLKAEFQGISLNQVYGQIEAEDAVRRA